MARPGLRVHRKFARLARALTPYCACGGKIAAAGVLDMLWNTAYESGDESIGDATDVENAVEWQGPSGILVPALLEAGGETAGFIEPIEGQPGRYRIHDLWDHAPEYVQRRRAREMSRQARGESLSDLRSRAGRKGYIVSHTTNFGHLPGKCPATDGHLPGKRPVTDGQTEPLPLPLPAPAPSSGDPTANAVGCELVNSPAPSPAAKKARNGQKDLRFEPAPPASSDIPPGKAVYAVFQYWREAFTKPTASLDGPRSKAIKQAIGWRRTARGCSRSEAVDEVQRALAAALMDPWCRGGNRSGEPITEIRTLLASAAILERLIAVANGADTGGNGEDDENPYELLNPGGSR